MDSSSPEIKNSSDWEQFSGQLIKVFFSSENAFGVTGALVCVYLSLKMNVSLYWSGGTLVYVCSLRKGKHEK